MKRARPGDDIAAYFSAPPFRWEASYGPRVGLTRAEAERGAYRPTRPWAAPPCCATAKARFHALCALFFDASPATPFSFTASTLPCNSAPVPTVHREVWLPPSLDRPAGVAFPGVRLGNRLFIYCAARLSAMLVGRDFTLLTPHPLLDGLAASAPYGSAGALRVECVPGRCAACAPPGSGSAGGGAAFAASAEDALGGELELNLPPAAFRASLAPHSAELARLCAAARGTFIVRSGADIPPSSPLFCPPLPLEAVLAAQGDIGRAWVQSQPSCGAAGALLQPFGALLAAWLQPFLLRAYTASMRATPTLGAGEGDWVVHVRAGDIWDERRGGAGSGGGGCGGGARGVNAAAPAYTPPPAWFYAHAAAYFGIRRAWVVTEKGDSSLVGAVCEALSAGGALVVAVVCGSEEGDFGTLLRARNLILSVSTFAWWAGALSPFSPAVVARTLARLAPAAPAFPPAAPVTVVVPLSGMLRPGSLHTVHADLRLAPHEGARWVDATAGAAAAGDAVARPLRLHRARVWAEPRAAALEAYRCTAEEAAWVLEKDVPAWAKEADAVWQ